MEYKLPQKPHLLKIIPPLQKSIVVKGDEIIWGNPWHFHPEIELLYCITGKGTNFIGNSISTIEEGELILIGKNLPHTRQRDKDYYKIHPQETPESVVVQFREDFLGDLFFHVNEFIHVADLLNRALRGLKFYGATREEAIEKLRLIHSNDPTLSILELLQILNILAKSREFIYLNPVNYINDANEKASQKINKVYQYTIENFREQIQLHDVAELTNHSVSAFCRYFKTRTRKSYIQYLTEIRVAYACKLLMEENHHISEVCYACGYNNFSNFHKQFKKIVHLSPSEYRKWGRNKVSAESTFSGF